MKQGIWIGVCLMLPAAGWVAPPADAGMSAKEIAGRMEQTLKSLRTLSATFVLTTQYETVDRAGASRGRILLQRAQNKLRLEQDHQTVVSDGESVWTYVPENRQIIVSPADQRQGGMRPDDFFFYYTERYTPALAGTDSLNGVAHYILNLTAKDEMADPRMLQVWVDSRQWLTRKVVYSDDLGTTTTIVFPDVRVNPVLPDETFVMPVPKGVEVVDLR